MLISATPSPSAPHAPDGARSDARLRPLLAALVGVVEQQSPDLLCSVLVRDGDRLRHGAAPRLPDAYTRAIDGIAIGPSAGSCGTAVHRGERVVVEDIAADPLWADFRGLAAAHGLRACWSAPIWGTGADGAGGTVLGTFACYYREPRRPAPADLALIDAAAALAAGILEGRHAAAERERLLADAEAAGAALARANAQLQHQRAELELANQRLQAQAAELEAQAASADAERARAEAILDGMADAYFALDADFRIVAVNAAMARGGGLARDQLLGRVFWDAFPGAAGTAFETHYRRVAAERVETHFTHDYSDGRLDLVVDVDAYPAAAGPDGRGGVAVFWRDVTQRARAEAERARLLAEAEASRAAADLERRRLLATLEQLPVGVHIAEAPGGRLVLGNAAVRRIWGGAPASTGVEAYSADYVATHRDGPRAGRVVANDEWPLARALATGEVVEGEVVEVARADGAGGTSRVLISLSAAPVRDADGRVVGGVVTSTDVTERERLLAAERLAAGRARLLQELTAAFSAELTPDGVVRVLLEHGVPALGAVTGLVLLRDADGARFTLAGAHGYPPGFAARFDGLPLDAALPVAAAARERRAVWIEEAAAGVRAYPGIAAVYAATGTGATAALPLADGAGRVVGALAFNFPGPRRFDAAARAFKGAVARQCAQALERARLFAAERAARAAAEQANAAKSQFLAVMSHELRTPLNAIAGYAELLELGLRGPLTDAQRADLARLRRANRHLTALVTDVLDFARLDAGRVEYHTEAVRLGPLVADLEALVGPQIAAKRLAYDHDACGPETPDRPHVVRADPEKVRQVLLNLLTNAVKFTEPGGRVSLACAHDAAAGVVRVRVTDTGRGIAADQLARIFEPFVQVDRHRTLESQQGVGLGLAISRDLARGMGGDLTAESAPGAGSTFTLTLPAA